MDISTVIQELGSAVKDAEQAKAAYDVTVKATMAAMADAQRNYDAIISEENAKLDTAAAALRDATVAVQRLRDAFNEALGGAFAPDPRVRMG